MKTSPLPFSILCAVVLASAPPVSSQELNPAGKPFPVQSLGRVVPAQQLPAQLGGRLGEVASWYGLNEAEFRQMLNQERSIRADRSGYLHYVCAGLVAPAGAAEGAAATVTQQIYPLEQTFRLHSRPGASRVIYLDFDGHVTSGTAWNQSFNGGSSFVTPAFDIDGDPTNFSSGELTRIQNIWRRVVEDFAIYDVDVTTEDPGLEALRRTSSGDTQFGVRVCIGGSSYDWFKSGAGGVAYLGSYNWSTDTPCYAFTAQLGNGHEKYTAEAVSHEIGHTLGLRHDGQTNGTEYYQGHGNWAPIMGVGYYREVTQWSKGEYSLANNTQDDIQVMLQYGLALRGDDHGDTPSAANVLSGTAVATTGIISTQQDVDLFRFTTGAGTVSFTAQPAVPSPNLDVELMLFDSNGNLLTSANPQGMSSELSFELPAGTFYLGVSGTGTGDPVSAYNHYGSLGEYALHGTVLPSTNQPPVVSLAQSGPLTGPAPLTVSFSSSGSYDSDGSISAYDWQFGDGGSSTEPNPAHTYQQPGTFEATLTLWDNGGLSSSASVTINVSQAPLTATMHIASLTLKNTSRKNNRSAQAEVTVRDQQGRLVSGADVSASWSGLAAANATVRTNNKGVAIFKSPVVPRAGTFFFAVNQIVRTGLTYDVNKNVATSASITLP